MICSILPLFCVLIHTQKSLCFVSEILVQCMCPHALILCDRIYVLWSIYLD